MQTDDDPASSHLSDVLARISTEQRARAASQGCRISRMPRSPPFGSEFNARSGFSSASSVGSQVSAQIQLEDCRTGAQRLPDGLRRWRAEYPSEHTPGVLAPPPAQSHTIAEDMPACLDHSVRLLPWDAEPHQPPPTRRSEATHERQDCDSESDPAPPAAPAWLWGCGQAAASAGRRIPETAAAAAPQPPLFRCYPFFLDSSDAAEAPDHSCYTSPVAAGNDGPAEPGRRGAPCPGPGKTTGQCEAGAW